MADETSIKQMLVKIVRECVLPTTIEEGVITKREPLAITLVNDKKMKLSKTDIILPARLEKVRWRLGIKLICLCAIMEKYTMFLTNHRRMEVLSWKWIQILCWT